MLSCVSRSFYSHAPSVYQHCHFRALHWNFLWVCFPQGDKIYQGLGKITEGTQPHAGTGSCNAGPPVPGRCRRNDTPCQERESRPANVAGAGGSWAMLHPVTAILSFLILLPVAHFNTLWFSATEGFFYSYLLQPLNSFLRACSHAHRQLHGFTSLFWELHLPVILLIFSFPGLFTPLLLWLAFWTPYIVNRFVNKYSFS